MKPKVVIETPFVISLKSENVGQTELSLAFTSITVLFVNEQEKVRRPPKINNWVSSRSPSSGIQKDINARLRDESTVE